MITGIEIENLRGIRSGKLEGMAPLTILTGPNACGKSTVLDALLIGASPDPADAVGRAVSRHPAVAASSRWLVGRHGSDAVIKTHPVAPSRTFRRQITWQDRGGENERGLLIQRGSPPPYSSVIIQQNSGKDRIGWKVSFGGDNQYLPHHSQADGINSVRLVDPGLPVPLHRTFTAVAEAGRRDDVHSLLAELIPEFERLEIIALTDSDFGLAVSQRGRFVPLGLSGDGIQAFVQVALEISLAPGGLVLVEEPEVYQHPKAIWQTAKALLANARRGVQTVITTHSLELIDALLGESSQEDRDGMALFHMVLEDGELRWGRRSGDDISFARMTLESDLR